MTSKSNKKGEFMKKKFVGFEQKKVFWTFWGSLICSFFTVKSAGYELDVWLNGSIALKRQIELIESAQSKVWIQAYSLVDDVVGDWIASVLCKKAHQGVEVKILIDAFSFNRNTRVAQKILQGGGEAAVYNWQFLVQWPPRLHAKLIWIDDHTLVVQGRNFNSHSFGLAKAGNRGDYTLRVSPRPPEADREHFLHFWNSNQTIKVSHQSNLRDQGCEVDPQYHDMVDQLKQIESTQGTQFNARDAYFYAETEKSKDRTVLGAIKAEIEQTVKSVVIETPRVAISENLWRFFRDQIARDLEIDILTSQITSFKEWAVLRGLGARRWPEDMARLGINLFDFTSAQLQDFSVDETQPLGTHREDAESWGLHSKIILLDQDRIGFGSFNFDILSERYNHEAILFLHSPELNQWMREIYAKRRSN